MCSNYLNKYILQTGRSFKKLFKEHIQSAIQSANPTKNNSKVSEHIQRNHYYSTINKSLKILHYLQKRKLINTLEKFEIHKNSLNDINLLLNGKLQCDLNVLYDMIIGYIDKNPTHSTSVQVNNSNSTFLDSGLTTILI